MVTNTIWCTFDVDASNDSPSLTEDFRLIVTPDQSSPSFYKLNASNPGQFYYNIPYTYPL